MQISTSRFGAVSLSVAEIWLFPCGLIGMEDQKHWMLIADGENERMGWLQSLSHSDTALPVVSPRDYCPDYDVHVKQADMLALELGDTHQALVLTTLSRNGSHLTVNLQAPLLVNKTCCLGRQILAANSLPLQLPAGTAPQTHKAAA